MPLLAMTKNFPEIGIVVKDLAVAAAFYGEVLDLPLVREVKISGAKALEAGCSSVPFRFKAFQVGDAQVKIVQVDGDPPVGTGKIDEATGVRYVTFSVENIDDAHRSLVAAGVHMQGEVVEAGAGRFMFFFTDPDGNLLECIGPR